MNGNDRLTAVAATLTTAGVVDVKFYFERGRLSSTPPSEVAAKVADFLELYADGAGARVASIGDQV